VFTLRANEHFFLLRNLFRFVFAKYHVDELLAELEHLRAENEHLRCRDAERQVVADGLLKRISELEKHLGLGDPPAKPPFVKAGTPKKENSDKRKKRSLQFFRRREEPARTVHHAADACPDCGHKLSGGSIRRTRQVVEIEPSPVEVTDHVIHRRYCGYCRKQVLPAVDFSGQVLGRRRIGLNLTSWIATLHIEGRIPIRTIQRLLLSLFRVRVSAGEIADLLDAAARKAKPTAEALLEEVRGSPFVHADETGWREAGRSGQLWSFSTPTTRYYRYDKSRGSAVPESVLGEGFKAVLATDFYCGYNRLACRHQRCWVHFARDLHKLREGGDAPRRSAPGSTPCSTSGGGRRSTRPAV
jgi:transposase